MDKCKIGAILKDRIKQQGFTQDEFAEMSGVGLSTLKKQLAGSTMYDYELLGKYAELLDCSYDYLLGYSTSPSREKHEIKTMTSLSDSAINVLCNELNCDDKTNINYFKRRALEEIVCDEDFLLYYVSYCGLNKPYTKTINGFIDDIQQNVMNQLEALIPIDKMIYATMICSLETIREKLKQEFLDDEREALAKINSFLDRHDMQK